MAEDRTADGREGGRGVVTPTISLPRGGGELRGAGEKFAAHPVSGTGAIGPLAGFSYSDVQALLRVLP
ncbi:hypothetical protein OG453_37810 [Streptomyces sp. NBC_01381]|uniref:hypothetical protein n=1 Tax=Streptomyces sp. NBC_01381 TaxID=2903845 RepID=UPI002259A494|nr:hypothetical protein [Streptomyces sp. NBC_01381]MCX4672355.1 hypothetical protein [Streptomyces sp. NBC_01381]